MSTVESVRIAMSSAPELLSSLESSNRCDCDALFDLVVQGLNHLHNGKGGKVRLENKFAYFDADFWDSKVYINIRLKQDHWSDVECLRTVYVKLTEMGYTKENRIEILHFDNRIHLFVPYKKPGFAVVNPSQSA